MILPATLAWICPRSGALGLTLCRPWASSLARMSSKSERRVAREAVAAYHEACLAKLIHRMSEAVESFRGELNAFDADQYIFQYSHAAKELWKFCNFPTPSSPHA